jgi:hypothetical protein
MDCRWRLFVASKEWRPRRLSNQACSALGGPGVLEGTFRKSGLRDVAVCPVAIRRKFPSLAEAIKSMKEGHAVLRNLLAKLNDTDRGRAWKEIEQAMSHFESANGFEAPGEVLIGAGTK